MAAVMQLASGATMTSNRSNDPFSFMLAPPPGESTLQRERRIRLEAEAKRISDAIDDQIKAEATKKKKMTEMRLLLLGQSGSGKSTLQKQFQLMYAPATLDAERSSWKPIVYMNLIKSARVILDCLENEYDLEIDRDAMNNLGTSTTFPSSSHKPIDAKGKGRMVYDDYDDDMDSPTYDTLPASWIQQLATLRLRLAPLLSMEEALGRKIGTGVKVAGKEEVFVRRGWQGLRSKGFSASKVFSKSTTSVDAPSDTASVTSSDQDLEMERRDDVVRQVASLILACNEDVAALYYHPAVKVLIKKRKLRLEESSSFFLSNLDRLASPDYYPTDDDILHARVRTMGITEHYFKVPVNIRGGPKLVAWRLYDVGGSRGQRPSWVPYFEDATAIIFLAPISAYDQYLEEDPRTNCMDDSLQLFTLICSSPLLKGCHLVLFLNKTDVLKKKLKSGVKVKKYITSYGDRPNEYESVSRYFQAHFKQVHRKHHADSSRELYTHLTSVIDTKSTRQVICDVRDAIFKDHLKESSML